MHKKAADLLKEQQQLFSVWALIRLPAPENYVYVHWINDL